MNSELITFARSCLGEKLGLRLRCYFFAAFFLAAFFLAFFLGWPPLIAPAILSFLSVAVVLAPTIREQCPRIKLELNAVYISFRSCQ
jgi:hypothetical protein